MPTRRRFDIGGYGGSSLASHTAGDEECTGCWGDFTPVSCNDPQCDGLIHQEFDDCGYDYIAFLYLCDVCGETEPPDMNEYGNPRS